MSTAHALKSDTAFTPRTGGGVTGGYISLVFGNDYSGFRAWYFVQIDPLRLPLYRKALKGSRPVDLEDYGSILISGYGEVPSDVENRMRSEHGWKG
jgi:hypothetical protein